MIRTILSVLALALAASACTGEVATATEAAQRPAVEVLAPVFPLSTCCVPYAFCEQLARCDALLIGLCRAGIDPAGGQCSSPGRAWCSLPTSWCADAGQ